MTVLVVAEHDNRSVKPATLNAVAAAAELSKAGAGDVHILVAGQDCRAAADLEYPAFRAAWRALPLFMYARTNCSSFLLKGFFLGVTIF